MEGCASLTRTNGSSNQRKLTHRLSGAPEANASNLAGSSASPALNDDGRNDPICDHEPTPRRLSTNEVVGSENPSRGRALLMDNDNRRTAMTTRIAALAGGVALVVLAPNATGAQSSLAVPTDPVIATMFGAQSSDALRVESADAVQYATSSKSPFLAGFLSFLVPGTGQFYNGQPAKGLLHLVLGVAAAGLAYQGFASDACQGWLETYWDAFSEQYRSRWVGGDECGWGYAGLGVSGALRIWSIYDGSSSASRLNARAGRVTAALVIDGPKRISAVGMLRF